MCATGSARIVHKANVCVSQVEVDAINSQLEPLTKVSRLMTAVRQVWLRSVCWRWLCGLLNPICCRRTPCRLPSYPVRASCRRRKSVPHAVGSDMLTLCCVDVAVILT